MNINTELVKYLNGISENVKEIDMNTIQDLENKIILQDLSTHIFYSLTFLLGIIFIIVSIRKIVKKYKDVKVIQVNNMFWDTTSYDEPELNILAVLVIALDLCILIVCTFMFFTVVSSFIQDFVFPEKTIIEYFNKNF